MSSLKSPANIGFTYNEPTPGPLPGWDTLWPRLLYLYVNITAIVSVAQTWKKHKKTYNLFLQRIAGRCTITTCDALGALGFLGILLKGIREKNNPVNNGIFTLSTGDRRILWTINHTRISIYFPSYQHKTTPEIDVSNTPWAPPTPVHPNSPGWTGPTSFSSHVWKDVKTYPHMINLWHIYCSFWGKCR